MSVEDPALTSPDIAHRERLDDRFAGRTGAQAPLLRVSGVPEDAVELAADCRDPDASSGRACPHDDDGVAHVGPFPPAGHGVPRRRFWAYALRTPVAGAPTRGEFLHEHCGEVVAQARLVATYSR